MSATFCIHSRLELVKGNNAKQRKTSSLSHLQGPLAGLFLQTHWEQECIRKLAGELCLPGLRRCLLGFADRFFTHTTNWRGLGSGLEQTSFLSSLPVLSGCVIFQNFHLKTWKPEIFATVSSQVLCCPSFLVGVSVTQHSP